MPFLPFTFCLLILAVHPSAEELPAKLPQRIVSLAPSVTETLFALHLGDKVVGVTNFCDYPEEAKKKPQVGGFITPSLEAILALQPDLVATVSVNPAEGVLAKLRELGVRVIIVPSHTFEDVFTAIETLGRATGSSAQAEQLKTGLRERIRRITERVHQAKRIKVLFALDHEPLITVGGHTFLDTMIQLAGGENITGDSPARFPRFSVEEVLIRNPEVILDASLGIDATPEQRERRRRAWLRWPSLPAVHNSRIYFVDSTSLLRPGPRIAEGIEQMARILHPELF